MAVTLSYSNIPIRGITYKSGSAFTCVKSVNGNGTSEGDGISAAALTVGSTYYVYAKASGSGVRFPYAVSTTSSGLPTGWYTEDIFPYATYSVTYNVNGGSGAISSQTKTYDTNLTLRTTKPTRTGYTFKGWGTSAGDTSVDYASGATYSKNAAITLYAIWEANGYTISFNANGGSGAPASVTKIHGTTLKLPTTIPTRTNYEFLGWSTSSTASVATYTAGSNYIANSGATLYAVWKLTYQPPTVTDLKVIRCDVNGNADDYGTYAKVTFSWSCDQNSGINNVSSIDIQHALPGSDTWTHWPVAATGTENTTSAIIGDGGLSVETSYQIKVTVVDTKKSDGKGATTKDATLPSAKFVIDFLSGGNGVAIGGVATLADTFEVNFATKLTGGITPVDIPINANLNDYTNPGFYRCQFSVTAATLTNSPTTVAFSLEVTENNGPKQVLTTYENSGFKTYVRQAYNNSWGKWTRLVYEGDVRTLSFKTPIASGVNLNAMGTPGTYACNDEVAASLGNCPTNYGFTMTIEYSYVDTGFITQHIYVPYHEIEYRRRYNTSNSTWSAWKSDFGHDTGWIKLNDVIEYRRVGRTVYVIGYSSGNVTLTSGSYTIVGTLPEGFRPDKLFPFSYDCIGGTMYTLTSYIESDGKISLYQNDSAGKNFWRFSASFPTNTSA